MIVLVQPRRSVRSVDGSAVPMINVVFLLLLYFLVAGRLMDTDTTPVQLPLGGEQAARAERLVLAVTERGHISLQGKHLEGPDLRNRLATLSPADAARGIDVRIDAQATSAHLAVVFDACREAGIDRIALVTRTGQ